MIDKLTQAADEVVIASTTGNPDLYQEKVGNRVRDLAEKHNDDPLAATRRAIVRAAAEIGRRPVSGM